jgi:long-subunit fatty acid transport protein
MHLDGLPLIAAAALLLAANLGTAGPATAAGLFTPDTGIVALGRGGAHVTRADDLMGALYYNPAGLFQLDGFHFEGGLLLLRHQRWVQRPGGDGGEDGGGIYNLDASGAIIEGSLDEAFPRAENIPSFRPIPELGLAFGFDRPDLTIAFGLYAPLAPNQRFSEFGAGRYRLIEQELIQANFSLSAAWKPLPFLAVGASFEVLLMKLSQSFKASSDFLASGDSYNVEDGQWDITAAFSATRVQPHFNVGVLVMPTSWLRVGLSFAPPYRFQGRGSSSLSGVLGEGYFAGPAGALAGSEPVYVEGVDPEIEVHTGLPGRLRFGIGFEPIQRVLNFEIGVHFEFWEGSGDVVASGVDMPLTYDNPDDGLDPVPLAQHLEERGICAILEGRDPPLDCASVAQYRGAAGDGIVVIPASFGNSFSLRFGGELRPTPSLGIRFGYLYESPAIGVGTQSLTMLDSHKHMASGGLSIALRGARAERSLAELHFSYAHIFYVTRTVAAEDSLGRTLTLEGVPSNGTDAGEYGGSADLFGVNLAVHFSAIVRGGRAGEGAK